MMSASSASSWLMLSWYCLNYNQLLELCVWYTERVPAQPHRPWIRARSWWGNSAFRMTTERMGRRTGKLARACLIDAWSVNAAVITNKGTNGASTTTTPSAIHSKVSPLSSKHHHRVLQDRWRAAHSKHYRVIGIGHHGLDSYGDWTAYSGRYSRLWVSPDYAYLML